MVLFTIQKLHQFARFLCKQSFNLIFIWTEQLDIRHVWLLFIFYDLHPCFVKHPVHCFIQEACCFVGLILEYEILDCVSVLLDFLDVLFFSIWHGIIIGEEFIIVCIASDVLEGLGYLNLRWCAVRYYSTDYA